LEEGSSLAGYSELISKHYLKIPVLDYLSAIGSKHKNYNKERW
jgi:hypothetical protein